MHRIYDKTDKGREEIATRRYRLAPRLRTLLLLLDGRQSTEHLLQKIGGLDEQSIIELLDGEFIQGIDDEVISESIEAIVDAGNVSAAKSQEQPPEPEITATNAPPISPAGLMLGETKLQAIQRFYTDTIRTTLGLRGYNFQLKVDQAESLEDLRALHDLYIAAVLKARGDIVAQDMHQQLEQLFALEDTPSTTE